MMQLLRLLSPQNYFHYHRDRTSKHEIIELTYNEQIWLSNLLQFLPSPSVYIKHMKYVELNRFNVSRSSYFSMVRDPVERIISWYYYVRAPWYYPERNRASPNISMPSKAWTLQGFEACVLNGYNECIFKKGQPRNDFAQITEYFCGQDEYCRNFNDDTALAKAMENIEKYYLVVGVLEDFSLTVKVLEKYIPHYFRGITKMYSDQYDNLSTMSRNIYKPEVDEKVKDLIRQNLTNEIALFQFCRKRLHEQLFALYDNVNS